MIEVGDIMRNILNKIIAIFILFLPLIDINRGIGLVCKILFLMLIVIFSIIKNKKNIIIYIPFIIYFIFTKTSEIYYPMLLISFYLLRDDFRISILPLFISSTLYSILILLNINYTHSTIYILLIMFPLLLERIKYNKKYLLLIPLFLVTFIYKKFYILSFSFVLNIINFIILFVVYSYVLYKVLNKDNISSFYLISLIFITCLSFFTNNYSFEIFSSLFIISLYKSKKRLLFSAYNLDLGGIEKALVNLANKIDKNKYDVTIILEEKKGIFLNKVKNVNIEELKVSNNNNKYVRKLTNISRKVIFSLFNYDLYDFSCCYATYSYSSNILARIASKNNSIYVHSDYSYLYNEKEFKKFFDTRSINKFKYIIFVSKESKNNFIKYYTNLKNKCIVINNFIDIDEIKLLSKEQIKEKKPKNKLFVFIGRLDDSSKKLKRAFDIVKFNKSVTLWVIGDGKDRKMYEEYVNSNKINDRVMFLGKKDNPYPYMNKADYIILTSDYEGFPVTYLESLTLNRPIITTIDVSDEYIDIKDYAYIISKSDKAKEEVKKILTKPVEKKKIDLNKVQDKRLKELERLFDGEEYEI